MVILHTEWWGDLYTHLPDVSEENKHASGLGFTWPLVKSEITGAIYHVEVTTDLSDPEATPFYNHRELNGEKIGWQRSIGVDLSSAENYYKSVETSVGQMQSILAVMEQLQRQYVDLVVSTSTGMGPIEQKFEQINAQFLAMHEIWVKFVFYYHRCALAPVWAEREGKSEAEIKLAQAYVNQLPDLEAIALSVYQSGQRILYENSVQIKTAKMQELNVKIAQEAAAAAAKAAEESKESSSSSGSSSGSTAVRYEGSGSMFDSVSENDLTLLMNDDLQGSTQGVKYGGSFTSEGYRPGSGSSHILYEFDSIREGYVEFEVKGMRNGDFDSDSDSAFFSMYDGRGVSEPILYGDFKHNHYRWNVHYRENRKAIKCVLVCATESRRSKSKAYDRDRSWYDEPTGNGISFDSSKWYKFRVEWKDKNFRVLINNSVYWATHGPYDYAPVEHRMWLGSGPWKYNQQSDNAVFRNLKVYKYK